MANRLQLIFSLRFYVGDTAQPYLYTDEELETYLSAEAKKVGLGTLYADWIDLPSRYDGVIVLGGYLNFLLKKGAAAVASSGVRIEELEVSASSGSDYTDLIDAVRKRVEKEEKDLGIGMPMLDADSTGRVTRFDRETHTYVPYAMANSPDVPTLAVSGTPAGGSVTFSWTRYRDIDFNYYVLEKSTDGGVTWAEALRVTDVQKNSGTLTGQASGSYQFHLSTVLLNQLKATSTAVPVTMP